MTARHKMPTAKPTTDRVALLRFQAQMADMARKVGARINELREERKAEDPRWTQDYLGRQVEDHLNGTQVSRYERGENMPNEKRLERIAEVLGTSVADLYAGPSNEREESGSGGLMEGLNSATEGSDAAEIDQVLLRMDALENELTAKLGSVEDALAEQRSLLETVLRNQEGGAG